MWLKTMLSFGLLALSTKAQTDDWWKTSTIYQIYPRSFKDSDGDGVGDLNGITSKLQHIKNTGSDALWLSPFYRSPQKDFGYDIANFTDVDPIFGTLDDFKVLAAEAKKLGLKVILDFVPNHSSDEHPWFKASIKRTKPYDEYYIWRDAKVGSNGTRVPPTNWLSEFGKSAWEWNEERGQYYYHAFVTGQPDLNYRCSELREEMNNVLRFWLKLGVDGFRVDAVWQMYETVELKDEPRSNNDVPPDDYAYLDHPYTKNLEENPVITGVWRKVLDEFGNDKPLIIENYESPYSILKSYYKNGGVPFNMMFILSIHMDSTPANYKRIIETWLNMVPEGEVTNWVVGNHDNPRAASRFGVYRVDQINMITAMLPGIQVIYNGDEIGMIDRPFTWNETVDPPGIIAGPERYHLKTRDPERTPFQWDNSTSAGFSTNSTTWLPVNNNYKTLNLQAQEQANVSHFKVFQDLTKLKKHSTLKYGSIVLLEKDNVLAVVRKLEDDKVLLLINFDTQQVTVDANNWLNVTSKTEVYTSSVQSGIKKGSIVDTTKVVMPPLASVILTYKKE